MEHSTFYHQSVLLQEAVDALQVKEAGIYVDCTFGGGGHSREILKRLGVSGRLIVFDHDKDAWANVPEDKRVILVKENFKYLRRFLRLHYFPKVDGILADLGVSSFQFDTAERGFSIRYDAALDMRMDNRLERTAAEIINTYKERELQKIFEQYGEVRNAKTLATTIVNARRMATVNTIADFKAMIDNCIKGNPNRYLAQVFQALRIEVNDEIGVLESFLKQTPDCMKEGGRLAVITFHSLEDRLVKNFMKKGTLAEEVETDEFGRPLIDKPFKVLKDVLPTQEEIRQNPRSRSARLRIAEKI